MSITSSDQPFDTQRFIHYCESMYQQNKAFDDKQTDRLARHRHLEPESAKFLASLVIAKQAFRVLEIGTSTGFSTLWLSYALNNLAQSGSQKNLQPKLISLDIDSKRSQAAWQHLQAVELSHQVDLQVIDAENFLKQNQQTFELIFLDAERKFYPHYIEYLHHALSVSHILVVDNVLSHADEVADFITTFKQDPRYLCNTLNIGAGLFMAVRQS